MAQKALRCLELLWQSPNAQMYKVRQVLTVHMLAGVAQCVGTL